MKVFKCWSLTLLDTQVIELQAKDHERQGLFDLVCFPFRCFRQHIERFELHMGMSGESRDIIRRAEKGDHAALKVTEMDDELRSEYDLRDVLRKVCPESAKISGDDLSS